MRLIDADALYEKAAEWEAQALHMVAVTMNDEDKTEWRRWNVILTERSAFKFDIADAPIIEPEPSQVSRDIATIIENEKDMRVIGERKRGKWIDHTDEGYVECPFCHSATNCEDNKEELHYCFSCGARMGSELRDYKNKGDDD